ncbi:MAG: TetR/AcrR family transcriptional regulator [Paracoccus sp. (in: a-proteobacteria)]|nr:TetR/AcrR family transcriptional regulator [Paracoccus sp. (in: a-proteobacteria)]
MSKVPSTAPLSERLIDAGMAILLSGQPLTLRGAAARAGVSHGAPAHHFDGLAGLQTAIAIRAFRKFGQHLERAMARPIPDEIDADRARLQNLGHAYIEFAREHFRLFYLMFVQPDVDRTNPDLVAAMDFAYQSLCKATEPYSRYHDPALIQTLFWTVAHGYVMLGLSDRVNGLPPPYGAPSMDEMMQKIGMLDALARPPKGGPPPSGTD